MQASKFLVVELRKCKSLLQNVISSHDSERAAIAAYAATKIGNGAFGPPMAILAKVGQCGSPEAILARVELLACYEYADCLYAE